MRGAAMSLTFVVLLLTLPVMKGENGWQVTYTPPQICALKGSTVIIHCSYTYPSTIYPVNPAEKRFWYTKESNGVYVDLRMDPEYSGRVQYHCGNNLCTLTITDLRESDSAEYYFRFLTSQPDGRYTGVPGVTLSVTDLQVQVSRTEVHTSYIRAELKCHSSCHLPGPPLYIWYKNGQKMWPPQSHSFTDDIYDPASSYSCAVTGHENSSSPTVYAPQLPSVSVSPSAEIVEGSSVNLTCSSDANPAANYTWYKKTVNPRPLSEEPQLVFRSIQSSDSGQYYCTAENELGRRTSEFISTDVQYAPKLPSVSVSPSAEIVEGSSVTLTCSSDANPAATYTWYKENQTLSQGQEGIYHFTSISSEDSGSYNCKSENQYGQINSSPILIDVQYAPKLPSVSVSPSAEIVEGSSVTLTCSSDANPAANYTWYKENINLRPLSEEPQLIFSSIQSSDSGQYYCAAENELATIFESILINVKYAPKLPSVSVSPSAEIVEGSSVTLTCSSDANPAAQYTWYKENEDSPKASGQIFTITDIRAEHSGNYYCEAHNSRGHHNSTLHLTVLAVFPEVWKSVVIGAAPGVSLAVIWLSVFLLIKKMRASKKPSEPGDRPDPDNREQGLPSHSEEQDDLHYASVYFKTHTDPVYSNIRPAGLRTDEEEAVEYTAVVFNSASTPLRTTGQKSGEDPAAVYSTVSKTDDHNRNL
ncbi:B-cell receptor CD22-like isoform X1 [Epinephelus lanceolatus]